MPPLYRIGTSGWSYKHWDGDFYPKELPNNRWLEHYAERFDTVEINNTFYRMPSTKTTEDWGKRVPDGFTFTFKVSRYITHLKRLQEPKEPLANFFERVGPVGQRHIGALLYQLPPDMKKDVPRLESFLEALPPKRQHVLEFRHTSWFDQEVLAVLRRHDVCFCVHDLRGIDCPVAATGPAAYFRFHGPGQAYAGNYTDEQLRDWTKRIRSISEEVETVYAYFNNDIGGHAVRNATTLREMLRG